MARIGDGGTEIGGWGKVHQAAAETAAPSPGLRVDPPWGSRATTTAATTGHDGPDNHSQTAQHQYVSQDQHRARTYVGPTHLGWETSTSDVPRGNDEAANE